jgi:hypothetical protein
MRYSLRSGGISVQQLAVAHGCSVDVTDVACNVGRVGPLRMAR